MKVGAMWRHSGAKSCINESAVMFSHVLHGPPMARHICAETGISCCNFSGFQPKSLSFLSEKKCLAEEIT
ncbi:uncharacterized protein J3R85_001797 [Psidium guajava]|nr:uncharacterized protein J3R85_001797 [Psidium guajava]